MRPGGWLLLGAVGCAVMVAASAWAPAQPEMITTGAACQAAPCGTLEDPDRWRQAWWFWSVGALVTALAAAFVLTPRQWSWRTALVLAVAAALLAVPVAVVAYVVSLGTSVQGGATAAVWVPITGIALVGAWARTPRTG